MKHSMAQQTQQLLLFEAQTRLHATKVRLEEMTNIHGPGNVVRITIPRISHLLKGYQELTPTIKN